MKNKVNRELFQSIGTATALIISVLALVVSIYEANLLKAQQKATVWPYFSISQGYNSDGFSIYGLNNGTGPALVTSVSVTFNGEPAVNYMDFLKIVKPDNTIGYDIIRQNKMNNTVFKAGEERLLFFMRWNEETREIVEKMEKEEVNITVQYCSVLEECWTFEYPSGERKKKKFKSALEFED
ncbi:hypothetical protein MTsPCn9_04870 [Croceitalea sp. MTPC9]|uniref:hypothetical protein n=1 Tax=unclassified Croceitalea TaxID=2632280 RepID=UPI002B3869CE|nr:hypothetical protein MTsPCn6_03840 [Croceitalea sp. MTPC6]GMN15551.1 hypothetical protein MTsPCn9_04870 [Croceitalea sp. MTPC9]